MMSRFDGGPIGEWQKPWLIQRLNRPRVLPEGHFLHGKDNPFAFGGGFRNGGFSPKAMDILRPIFSFDYMGSAEFELGTVPKAMQSMITSSEDLGTTSFEIEQADVRFDPLDERHFHPAVKGVKRVVHLISKTSHQKPAEKYIRSMIEKVPPQLKGHSNFKRALLDPKDLKEGWLTQTQGWLDVDNCLFFFTDSKMFEQVKAIFFEVPKETKA